MVTMQVLFCQEEDGRSVLDGVVLGDSRDRGREVRGGEPLTLALRHSSDGRAGQGSCLHGRAVPPVGGRLVPPVQVELVSDG